MARTILVIDSETLTFMLGYLSPEAWVNALCQPHLDTDLIKQLIKIQEETWGITIIDEEES